MRARTIAPLSFLVNGDIEGLLAWHRSAFGDARMDGAGAGDGGGGAGTGGAGGGGAGSGGAGAPGSGGTGDGGQGGQQGGKPFTAPSSQAELDAIINQAVARTHAKYSDHDDLAAKAKKWDEAQAASQSEVERLTAERDAANKKAEDAGATAVKMARDAAIVVEAAKAGAKNPQHVVALLPADAVTVDKDGNVTGADIAVKKFAEENPDYFGTATTRRQGPPAHGLGAREGTDPTPGERGRQEAAKRFGKDKAAAAAQ